jgi:hypothetical protein
MEYDSAFPKIVSREVPLMRPKVALAVAFSETYTVVGGEMCGGCATCCTFTITTAVVLMTAASHVPELPTWSEARLNY